MTRPPMPGSVIIIKFDCAIFSQQNSGLDSGDPIKIKTLDPENFWVQISELQNRGRWKEEMRSGEGKS